MVFSLTLVILASRYFRRHQITLPVICDIHQKFNQKEVELLNSVTFPECKAKGKQNPNICWKRLVIPVQTATFERGNSCLNRIMTDQRCSLAVKTAETLMHISTSGGSAEEYD